MLSVLGHELRDTQKRLELGDLYRKEGDYTYSGGWNWRATIATLIGCAFAWIGLVVPALRPLYDYAWFIGFGAAAFRFVGSRHTKPKSVLRVRPVRPVVFRLWLPVTYETAPR